MHCCGRDSDQANLLPVMMLTAHQYGMLLPCDRSAVQAALTSGSFAHHLILQGLRERRVELEPACVAVLLLGPLQLFA